VSDTAQSGLLAHRLDSGAQDNRTALFLREGQKTLRPQRPFYQGQNGHHRPQSPWGIALAPAGFGDFSGDLLVANKTGGLINAYDANTFNFIGSLLNVNGTPISIPGIWAIATRAASSNFNTSAIYFAAGVNGTGGNFFADGEFGVITAVPEPSSAILLGLGLIVLCGCGYQQVRRRLQARPVQVA
jgi:hypothetical protein